MLQCQLFSSSFSSFFFFISFFYYFYFFIKETQKKSFFFFFSFASNKKDEQKQNKKKQNQRVKKNFWHSPRFSCICWNNGRIKWHCIVARQQSRWFLIIFMNCRYTNIWWILLLHLLSFVAVYSWKILFLHSFISFSLFFCEIFSLRMCANLKESKKWQWMLEKLQSLLWCMNLL